MIETRIVKIVMLGSLALFAGLVTFDNLTDYEPTTPLSGMAEHGRDAARKTH
jgi:hypothetical protein